jgi:hypothetical protein
MEFLQHSRRRTVLSEIVYILLNIAFAVAALIAVASTNNLWVGVFIVLLGKWRILAVRPHYWAANVMANMVDIIVSLSYIVLIYTASGALWVQLSLTLWYILWLLLLKPRSKRVYVLWQALAAVLFGVSALVQISYDWIGTVFVIGMWLIGYISARHVLIAYKEPHTAIYSLVWGLVLAEIGWIFYHWMFAFDLGIGQLQLAFATIVATLLSFLAERIYASYRHRKKIAIGDVILPLLFTLGIIAVGLVRGIQLYGSAIGQ